MKTSCQQLIGSPSGPLLQLFEEMIFFTKTSQIKFKVLGRFKISSHFSNKLVEELKELKKLTTNRGVGKVKINLCHINARFSVNIININYN